MKPVEAADAWPLKCYVVLLAVCAFAVLILMPGLVGALVENRGYDPAGAGQVGAANLAGIALTSLLGFFTVDRWHLRLTTVLGAGLVLVMQLLCTQVLSLPLLIGLQFLAGVGGGLMVVSGLGVLGSLKNPDSVASLMLVGQLGFGVLFYQFLGPLLALYSVTGLFVVLALLAVPLLLCVGVMPVRSFSERAPQADAPLLKILSLGAVLILIAELLMYTANTAVYAYLDRIGTGGGLASEVVNDTLSLTNLSAMLGGLAVAYWGTRLGRQLPVIAALSVMAVSFGGLHLFASAAQYKLFSCLVLTSLCIAMPYVIGLLVELDPSGRLASLSNCLVSVGAALGPFAGGMLLVGQSGFPVLLAVCAVVILLALFLLFVGIGTNRHFSF